MTEDREALFKKIRGLLRQAEGTTYEDEAITFYEKAQELMLSYAVSEEELWESEPEKRDEPEIIRFDIPKSKSGAMSKRIILNACAKANNCRAWYSGSTMSVAGYKSDLLFVDMLYTSIQMQMSMSLAFGLAKAMDDPRSFRASFQEGYSEQIHRRLRGTRRRVTEETNGNSTSKALMLMSREAKIEKFVEDNVGKLRSQSRSSRIGSEEGYYSGRKAGADADLSGGKGKIGGSRRELSSG